MKYPLNSQPLCPVSHFLSGEMSTLVTLCNQRTAIHCYQSVKHLKCTALVSGLAWPNSKPVAVSTVIKVKLASSDSGRGPTKSTCHRVKGTLPSPPVHQWLPDCGGKELPCAHIEHSWQASAISLQEIGRSHPLAIAYLVFVPA